MKEILSPVLRRITLKQLRVLAAVQQAKTMSGAARMLHVTPPAINLQVKLLEETTGMALFEQAVDGMRLTPVGQDLRATATQIETALSEFAELLDAHQGLRIGHVDVGVVNTAKYFVPRAMAAFTKRHPSVDMRLQVGNRGDMIGALEQHQLDFVIMGQPPAGLAAHSVVIADHPHMIIAPPDHPLVKARRIKLKDLHENTFLLRESTSGTRQLLQRLFAQAGLTPDLGMEIGSNETIKQAVMAGLGIALISAHTVHAELADGRLKELDVVGLPIIRQWFLVKLQKKRLLPAAQAFWDFILNSSGKYLPGN